LGPEREIQARATWRRSTIGPRCAAPSAERRESAFVLTVDAPRSLLAPRRPGDRKL
jgi:hypothetical protein